MQQPVRSIPHNRHTFTILTFPPNKNSVGCRVAGRVCLSSIVLTALLSLLVLTGCDNQVVPPRTPGTYEGQKITLRCPDAAFADAITPMVKAWEVRTGATVTIARETMTSADDSDLGIIPTNDLGAWAEPGLLSPVPPKLRASDNPFQWFGLLPAYGERLVEWGGQTQAIPLTSDGFVIVYRADRFADKTAEEEFQKQYKHALTAPATWEEFADVAEFFAKRDKTPSLPPLPADPEGMFDLFCRVAASADRRAFNDVELTSRTARDRDALAFQVSTTTGKPRLNSFGFQYAAQWLDRLQTAKAIPAVPPGGLADPIPALADGRAVLAVVSLAQLARLPRENGGVPTRFAISGIPGSGTYPNPDTGKPVIAPSPNYVPYFSGGRLGVVRTRCPHPEAAFDLLADLGGPARSAELVSTPGLGAGPVRIAYLDRDHLIVWLGYALSAERSKELQDALRHFAGQSVKNPTFELRGPDRSSLVAAAADPLRKIGVGLKPNDALAQAEAAWQALNAKVPPETLQAWQRHAAGLK